MSTDSSAVSERTPIVTGVVRFAGDSGDGIQLMGSRFTHAAARAGYDLATVPDFPAEIRAPAGTTFGVSSFQIRFGSDAVRNPGDRVDTLVVMNPAALRVHRESVASGGTIILNSGAFTERNLQRAGCEQDPRYDGSLEGLRVVEVDIGAQTVEAVDGLGLGRKQASKCRNMYALGLTLWMYGASTEPARAWIQEKFGEESATAQANLRALEAGHAFGETAELAATPPSYAMEPAVKPDGLYRTITGGEALSYGLLVGAHKVGRPLYFGSYPITPASPILHHLTRLQGYNATAFQAEDEIAAISSAVGAAFGGHLAATATSGPGMALKTEALGLAVAAELPMVVIDCQRAGPSTGLPTKSEQTDLLMAIWGRPGEAPLPVLAPSTPAECFDSVVEACRIAVRHMTPVIVLADGYLVNAAEPWLLPDVSRIPDAPAQLHRDPEHFAPFARDEETLARPWAVPGTPGLEHRIGGLERESGSGNVSYDPKNHQYMMDTRAAKVARVAEDQPRQGVEVGPEQGELAVVSWGSTYGTVREAVEGARQQGGDVAHIHLRTLDPLPEGLGELLAGFRQVLVPELNSGQLRTLLRDRYLIDAQGFNQTNGMPIRVADLAPAIERRLT